MFISIGEQSVTASLIIKSLGKLRTGGIILNQIRSLSQLPLTNLTLLSEMLERILLKIRIKTSMTVITACATQRF